MNGRFFGACFLFGRKKRSYRSITNLFFGDFATAPSRPLSLSDFRSRLNSMKEKDPKQHPDPFLSSLFT